MKVSYRVEGLDELARNLRALPDAVGKKTMRQALKSGAEPIRGTAGALMARSSKSPHAADHVGITLGRSGYSAVVGPTRDFFYWRFQELGTVRHPPQPALRPAFDSQAPNALHIIGRELWKAVRGEAERHVSGIGGRFL